MIEEELVKRLTLLERRVDGLIKPEVALGMSLISDTTLGLVASATISGLPQGFRHLIVFGEFRSAAVAETDILLVQFNADSGTNYDIQLLRVNGATVSGAVARGGNLSVGRTEAANSRAQNASPQMIWIYDYARTASEKWTACISASFGDVSADTDMFEEIRVGRWRNTAAITSIIFLMNSGSAIVAGSRFQLYGIM